MLRFITGLATVHLLSEGYLVFQITSILSLLMIYSQWDLKKNLFDEWFYLPLMQKKALHCTLVVLSISFQNLRLKKAFLKCDVSSKKTSFMS